MVFEVIDTPEKAWLLGWIATDGNVNLSPTWQITICLKDGESERYVCQKFQQIAGGNIRNSVRKKNGLTENYAVTYWQLSRKVECENLGALGITPRKSLTIGRLAVPEEFIWPFMRGVFEGDGSVWLRKGRLPSVSFTTGSKEFAEWIAGVIGAVVRETPKRGKVYYSVGFTDRANVERLFHSLYDGAGEFALSRKKEKLEIGLASYMSHEQRSEVGRRNAQVGMDKFKREGRLTNIELVNQRKQVVTIQCEDCGTTVETKTWNTKVCKGCSAERNRVRMRQTYQNRFVDVPVSTGNPAFK